MRAGFTRDLAGGFIGNRTRCKDGGNMVLLMVSITLRTRFGVPSLIGVNYQR